jgi:electron transport complex protein RnfG
MKDILTIIFRLTVACLMAGVIMGATFVFTNKAKQQNIQRNEQRVMLGLLGYSAAHPAPKTLAMHEVYRYLVSNGTSQALGYLLPAAGNEEGKETFVTIDLDGKFQTQTPVSLSPDKISDEGQRTAAIQAAIGQGQTLRYADQTIIVTDNGKRVAYLLPGKFPGFKTFVSVILALDQDLTIKGLEIMENEEDPGLGGEIVQKYFKNQFIGKTIKAIENLGVIKTPLPEEYRRALEADKGSRLGPDEIKKIESQYQDKDIYALTGATISSRAVTNGVKGIVQKFAYRLGILDRVLKEQQIPVPF